MVRVACVCITALCLVLAGIGEADAQKKRKRRGKRAPAPSAQPAEPPAEPAEQSEGEAAAGEAQADGAAMEISPAEAESGEAASPADGEATSEPPSAQQAAPESEPGADDAELSALRQELAALMDELVQARAMVATLGKALFKTRVRIMLEDHALDEQRASRVAIYLDGAPVFRGDGGSIPSDPAHAVFEGFAAPGAHELTLEVEHRAREADEYRYSLRNTFRFEVVREHRTDLRLVIEDDSDMAEDFGDDREGSYEVESRLEVVAEPFEK